MSCGSHSGSVVEFDADRGLGVLASADGRTFEFHAIEIADGTRSIAVGHAVRFGALPKFGRYEAGAIEKV